VVKLGKIIGDSSRMITLDQAIGEVDNEQVLVDQQYFNSGL
jgi:hypothetical protein